MDTLGKHIKVKKASDEEIGEFRKRQGEYEEWENSVL